VKRVLGERGNVVAFIVIAIIALVFILLLSRHEPVQISKDVNTESKVETITTENIRRASRQALQKFAKGGYSEESSVWVCNSFMPPLSNEVDSNFESLLSKDLNDIYFTTIKKELGYKYDENLGVSLGLKTEGGAMTEKAKMLSLPEDRVDVNVSFVLVSTEGKNEERALENPMFESYSYRKWHLYKDYTEWAETYLPLLGQGVCTILTAAHPCLFSACSGPGSGILIPDNVVKGYVDLSKISAVQPVQTQLQYLNSIMNSDDFDCELENYTESTGLVIARMQRCDHCRQGCFIVANAMACGSWQGKSGFSCPAYREILGPDVYPPGAPPEFNNLVSCPADLNKQEAVAANSHIFFSFNFSCTDRTKSISWEPAVEKSTAKIGVVIGMTRTCYPQYMCPQTPGGGNPPPTPNPTPSTTPSVTPTATPTAGYCPDGTPYGTCALTQPRYCRPTGDLVSYCTYCGCPQGLTCNKTTELCD
jgi:hypothetical protein